MTLYDILLLILTNHSIDELGLLPCISDKDELPQSTQQYHPLFVFESKLGISLESIVVLLREAQQRFLCYQQSNDLIQLEQASRILIMLKPDHYTAMNARKKLIQSGHIKIQDEIKLINLIFTIPRNTKSSIAWHHRKWLFQYQQSKEIHDLDMDKEIKICERCIQLHPRNYYAWEYRYWFIVTFLKHDIKKIINEYEAMCQWIEKNVSDHSGISYLEHILKLLTTLLPIQEENEEDDDEKEKEKEKEKEEIENKMKKANPNFKFIMQTHLIWLDRLILSYEGHETLWCHRRFYSHLWMHIIHPSPSGSSSSSSLSSSSSWFICQHEFIKRLLLKFNAFHLKDVNNDDDIALFKQQQQQFVLASKFGLWLCLLEKRQVKNNEQTKNNELIDFYLKQLRLYDSTPIYSSWKLYL